MSDKPTNRLTHRLFQLQCRIFITHTLENVADQGQLKEVLNREQSRRDAIVDIMIVISNIIRQGCDLGFGSSKLI